MIKKLTIIGLLIFTSLSGLPQKDKLPITHKEIIAGKNYLTNQDIEGHQYSFPCLIYNWTIDTTLWRITFQLRYLRRNGKYYKNKGFLTVYDLQNNKTLWSHKIQSFDIQQSKDMLIRTIDNESSRLNYFNGRKLWTSKYKIYYVDQLSKIGLGYYTGPSMKPSNNLKGIDLSDGSVIWERELNREFGWNELLYLHDSVIIIVSSGLHAINLINGSGWDYNVATGEKDYTAAIATTAAGVALGLLTGTYVYRTGPNIVRNIVSNIILNEAKIYFASKESVVCLDYNGNVIWETPLPKNSASKSSLLMRDSILYMLNQGYAFMGYRKIDYGKPFLSAYYINEGKQKFFKVFEDKEQISAFKIQKDTLLLTFKNKISKHLLTNGSLI